MDWRVSTDRAGTARTGIPATVHHSDRPHRAVVARGHNGDWQVAMVGGASAPMVTNDMSTAVDLARTYLLGIGGGELEIRRRDGTHETWVVDHP